MTREQVILATGDVCALAAFGLIGLASHDEGFGVTPIARSVLPFVASWLIVASLGGVLGHDVSWQRLVAAWLVAGVVALVARSLIFDRALLNAFFAIALAGNGLFMFGWRAALGWRAARVRAMRILTSGPEHAQGET